MLHFERVFYKVLFVVSGLDVRLRVPVSTTVKDGKKKQETKEEVRSKKGSKKHEEVKK